MRKCRNCLCRSCMNTCYNCHNCTKSLKTCEKHSGYEQMWIFALLSGKRYQTAPRASWNTYGISRERYLALKAAIQSGQYAAEARSAADETNASIAQYILISVMKNKSYEGIEYVEGLGRIPCGRTDFYGYRRLFYHLLNEKLKIEASNIEYFR